MENKDTKNTMQKYIVSKKTAVSERISIACHSAYHTKAWCKPEYAKSGIINSIRISNIGAKTDSNMDLKEGCLAVASSLYFLVEMKNNSTMPKTIQIRKTVNNKPVPATLSSYSKITRGISKACQKNKY